MIHFFFRWFCCIPFEAGYFNMFLPWPGSMESSPEPHREPCLIWIQVHIHVQIIWVKVRFWKVVNFYWLCFEMIFLNNCKCFHFHHLRPQSPDNLGWDGFSKSFHVILWQGHFFRFWVSGIGRYLTFPFFKLEKLFFIIFFTANKFNYNKCLPLDRNVSKFSEFFSLPDLASSDQPFSWFLECMVPGVRSCPSLDPHLHHDSLHHLQILALSTKRNWKKIKKSYIFSILLL